MKPDTTLITRDDLPAAVGLLTRIPTPVDAEKATARGAAAVWAFPLVGVVIGAILSVTTAFLLGVGVPAGIAAALIMAVSVMITGAMHEDGLADTADGLWGGWDRARRLEIMKDSHIGVYGVCAIAIGLLLRWLALVVVISFGAYWMVFIAVGALSRASMIAMMALLPNARDSGLSHKVGRPAHNAVWLGLGIAAVVAVICGYLVLIPIVVVATALCGLIARSKIGGQTGDILGATQQVTEIAMLITVVTAIS